MAKVEVPGKAAAKSAEERAPAAADRRGKTVLVVEDSATTRKVITIILQNEGFDVVTAKDGLDAVTKFKEIVPDLVLLDIIMPGMDGYQVLSIIKKNKSLKDIPVIMLTAKSQDVDVVKGYQEGIASYMTKPFNLNELVDNINLIFESGSGESNK